jgi:hypothetical protein
MASRVAIGKGVGPSAKVYFCSGHALSTGPAFGPIFPICDQGALPTWLRGRTRPTVPVPDDGVKLQELLAVLKAGGAGCPAKPPCPDAQFAIKTGYGSGVLDTEPLGAPSEQLIKLRFGRPDDLLLQHLNQPVDRGIADYRF